MLEKTEGTIKNWQSSILTTCIIPTLLTLFPFPLFILFKLSFKTTFNSVFFPFYVILYRIRTEHYSSTYWLLYHCANDWFFGQLHKCSLHHKNMRLCEVKTIFFCCVPRFVLKFCHISKVKIWIATDRSVSPHLAKWLANSLILIILMTV
jgi:ABC-type maltose transport system permease subunit